MKDDNNKSSFRNAQENMLDLQSKIQQIQSDNENLKRENSYLVSFRYLAEQLESEKQSIIDSSEKLKIRIREEIDRREAQEAEKSRILEELTGLRREFDSRRDVDFSKVVLVDIANERNKENNTEVIRVFFSLEQFI